VRRLVPVLLILVAAGSCGRSDQGRSDQELGGLVRAPSSAPEAIDPARAASSPAELVRAVSLSHAQVSSLLGPHRVTGRSRLEVRDGSTVVEELDDEIEIRLDGAGNFHARMHNSKEYGREVFLVDGALYLRPRYGKFHRRAPNDEAEPDQIRGEIFGALAAHLELVAPSLAVSDGGATEVSGRAARRIVLGHGTAAPSPAQTSPQRSWRASAVVVEISGEVALDAETGAPLRAKLSGVVNFQKEGKPLEMRLEAEHELASFGKVAAVAAPEPDQVVSGIEQRHELEERESLLKGIAPPSRRGPTP
jgi:hypothetical protein